MPPTAMPAVCLVHVAPKLSHLNLPTFQLHSQLYLSQQPKLPKTRARTEHLPALLKSEILSVPCQMGLSSSEAARGHTKDMFNAGL